EEAERLSDRVVIMDRGRVVAEGSPEELTGAERQLRFRARPGLGLDELIAALPAGSAAKESPAGHYLSEADVRPEPLATLTAWRLADRVVIMDRGRVVAEGSPEELTGAERQLRFRARPGLGLDELIAALPAGSAAKESPAGHYLIEADVRPELLATVTAWCAS